MTYLCFCDYRQELYLVKFYYISYNHKSIKMTILIALLLSPFLINGQQHSSANYGNSNVESVNNQVKHDKFDKSWTLNIIGSKFYHDEFLSTIVNGKEINVKYDAFDDFMRSQVGPNIFSFPENEILLLDNKESWITYNNSWFRILVRRNDFTYLLKPIAKYYPAKKSDGFSENTPPEFKIKNKFYSLKDDNIILLKRKEIKKLGLKKMFKN